jgi:aryl-alcohol dehydrogenase-like predicted oxidoreductase
MTMGWQNDERESHRILDHAFHRGINFFDTADIYSNWVEGNPGGVSERIIGKWLKTKLRKDVVIATKARGRMWEGPDGEGLSRAHLMRACDDSLKRLGVDFIDLYQCHSPDESVPIQETMEALGELVKSGKVRWLGLSNYTALQHRQMNDYADNQGLPRFICNQPKYNLTLRSRVEPDLSEYCLHENIAIIPYSPLEGGLLTGKYQPGKPLPENARHTLNQRAPEKLTSQVVRVLEKLKEISQRRGETMTQTALAWGLTKTFITSPIIGATSIAQLDDALGAAGKRLTADEERALDEVSAGL